MDFGQLYAGLNALDVAMVKRNPDGTFAGLKEGSETLGIPTVKVNPVTEMLEIFAGTDAVITCGTNAPNDADGKPDGSIYFQI